VTRGPLVVLHDHLDGGVRPQTVLDLARSAGVATPADSVADLARWFTVTPDMSLVEAFSRFDLVGRVMQSPSALRRVAREACEDLAADGVIYAELRFAPLLHTLGGLTAAEVIAAVEQGLDDAEGLGLVARLIVCAMRGESPSTSMAAVQAALAAQGRVVGVDLAGAEVGNPASVHAAAFSAAHEAGIGVTIHAGEMDGAHQVADALQSCAPDRIGHGWRLIDDCVVSGRRIVDLGPTARAVRDGGIPLEVCLTSNACLGLAIEDHPVRMLHDAGFQISLNPDDRAITTTTASHEIELAAKVHGFSDYEIAATTERAAAAAFLAESERTALVETVRRHWDVYPSRLVHLAERGRWEAARSGQSYLPAEFGADGFIHLSALHQVLTPANRFYKGRTDLVALVVDAHLIANALVWEPGTGTLEWFPHLYGALGTDAVLHSVDFLPDANGSFLLPAELVRAVAG